MKGGFYLNTNQSTFSRLFFLASEGRWKLVLSCTLMTIGTLCGMIPYVSVYMITRELLMGEGEQNIIILWSLIALVSLILNGVLTFLGSLGAHKIAFRVLYGIRVKVMEHLGKLSMGFFTSRTTGSVQKTTDESIEKIEIFIAHLLPDLFGSAFAVLALLIGLGTLNIWLAIAVVVAVIGALLLQMLVWGGKRGQDILTGLASMSGRMTGAFGEYVKGIAEVKLFGHKRVPRKETDFFCAKQLSIALGGQKILDEIEFSTDRGKILAVLGGNGAGKTTLCRVLTGLHKRNVGQIFIDGKEAKSNTRVWKTFFAMQDADYQLYAATVEDEFFIGSGKKTVKKERVAELLSEVGLKGFEQRNPLSLSGGEKQRLLLALAVAYDKDVIVLDEPTSGLDGANMRLTAKFIKNLADKGKCIILITHDRELISLVADTLLYLDKGKAIYHRYLLKSEWANL